MAFKKSSVPWNKGKAGVYSDETRRRMGMANIGNTYSKGRVCSIETRKRISEAKKGKPINYHRTPEGNRRMRETNTGLFQKGHMPWSAGQFLSDEVRQKISTTCKTKGIQPSDEVREKAKEIIQNTPRSVEHRRKLSLALTGHKNSLEARAKMSKSHTGVPLSEEHKSALVQAVFKACKRRPTKPEKILGELINKVCPKKYKYTGDGTMIIGHRNPDYTNVNGRKSVILLHGVYWHLLAKQKENPLLTKDDVEEADKKSYKEYGWDCLIIWEDELRDSKKVAGKIMRFEGGKRW